MTSEIVRGTVLLGALVVAVLVGVLLRRRAGRVRAVAGHDVLRPTDLGADLGARATFLQFSSEVCAPCRATRRVLGDLVDAVPGVVHVELDAAQRLDLVRRLGVVRTPTVLVLDAAGRVRSRASGALTPAAAREALAGLVPDVVRS
jgi:thiol-disulfide isomerase/thioredoxin